MESNRIDDDEDDTNPIENNAELFELNKQVNVLLQENTNNEMLKIFFQKISQMDDKNLTETIDEMIKRLHNKSNVSRVLSEIVLDFL